MVVAVGGSVSVVVVGGGRLLVMWRRTDGWMIWVQVVAGLCDFPPTTLGLD